MRVEKGSDLILHQNSLRRYSCSILTNHHGQDSPVSSYFFHDTIPYSSPRRNTTNPDIPGHSRTISGVTGALIIWIDIPDMGSVCKS